MDRKPRFVVREDNTRTRTNNTAAATKRNAADEWNVEINCHNHLIVVHTKKGRCSRCGHTFSTLDDDTWE